MKQLARIFEAFDFVEMLLTVLVGTIIFFGSLGYLLYRAFQGGHIVRAGLLCALLLAAFIALAVDIKRRRLGISSVIVITLWALCVFVAAFTVVF